MGLIVDGQWVDEWYDTEKSGGRFERQNSAFRHWIGSEDGRFAAESGRYTYTFPLPVRGLTER